MHFFILRLPSGKVKSKKKQIHTASSVFLSRMQKGNEKHAHNDDLAFIRLYQIYKKI
jgi:hypothetical protein